MDCELGDDELFCDNLFACPQYCFCPTSFIVICFRQDFRTKNQKMLTSILEIKSFFKTITIIGFNSNDFIKNLYLYHVTNLNVTKSKLFMKNNTKLIIEKFKNLVILDLTENKI